MKGDIVGRPNPDAKIAPSRASVKNFFWILTPQKKG